MFGNKKKEGQSKIGSGELYNQFIPGSLEKGHSAIYRRRGNDELVSTPDQGMKNVRDILEYCRKKFGERNGFGKVLVNGQRNEKGEDVETRLTINYTFEHVYDQAYMLGRALRDRKLAQKQPELGMNLIGIFSKNRLEWFVTDWACVLFGYTTTPLYDTLGKQNLAHCIKLSGITTLFVSAATAAELCKFNERGSLHTVISYDTLSEEMVHNLKGLGLTVLNYWQLIEEGSKSKTTNEDIVIKGEDIYTFCYTSGTTGVPKGALVTHANMMASTASFIMEPTLNLNLNDVYLSYLPLPHMMERAVSMAVTYAGGQVMVSSGNTMKLKEDCFVSKCTVFISVPRLWNRIVDGVNEKIKASVTDESKRAYVENAVFDGTRKAFGGKIRIMASGSAPLNPTVHNMMERIMGCPLVQGYGLTETPVAVVYSRNNSTSYGMMHELSVGCEVRLEDIPEMKYTASDKDSQGNSTPRGELCVRGPQIFKGYYKMPEATKEVISSDGWFHTGDIAEITPNLAIRIIDRKKNVFKLQQGEYVAPDIVETVYMKSGLIQEIFLHGTSVHSFAVAVIVPKKQVLTDIISRLGIYGKIEEACRSVQVRTEYLAQLNKFCRDQGLVGFQVAKNVHFQLNGFLARGILTNTMKMIRFEARTCYKNQIEAMYAEGELKL